MVQFKKVFSLPIFAVSLFIVSSTAMAGTTGKIAGIVTEKETGEVLPGANVIVEGTMLGAATNLNGQYFILNVPPGVYTVKASFIGYQTTSVTQVRVNIDLTTTVDFQLPAKALVGAEVVIVAEHPMIQKDGVTTMQVVESDIVENMVADDFKDVLTLNSGVTTYQITAGSDYDSGEGEFYVRGGRGNELAFMIDGVQARSGISGLMGTEIANPAIEELQLITGNFNAEYGNAMSGVLNLVSKEGGNETSFRVRGFTDAIFGKKTSDWKFADRDRLMQEDGMLSRPNWGTYQGQFNIGGPLPGFGNKIRYFVAGEYFQTDGYIGVLQDNIARRSTAKLTFSPSSGTKFNLTANVNSEDLQVYDHDYGPDGEYFQFLAGDSTRNNDRAGNNHLETRTKQGIARWTQSLGSKAFFDLKFQYFSHKFFNGARKGIDKEIEQGTFVQPIWSHGESFIIAGNDPIFIDENEATWEGKLDLTWQANINHNLKGGVDFNYHDVKRRELWVPGGVAAQLRIDNEHYHPVEAAAYIQDKIEFKDLIINAGMRLDYFKAGASVVADFNDPLGRLEKGKTRITVSPRFGIAHPVTDRANLHFSYGHFYQMPEYNKLVRNQQRTLEVPLPTLGNSNLKPQKTTAFEVGWDQQLTDFLAVSATGFYKDIENLVTTDVYQKARPTVVTYFVNQDFANVRGLEINLRTRRYHHIATYFSYTISRAEGNNSNPTDVRDDLFANPPRVPIKRLIVMDWDVPHVFNFNIDFRYGRGKGPKFLENFGVNLTGHFRSGFPYTPTDARDRPIGERNSARSPSTWQMDLRADKLFDISGGMKLGVFTEITNLTNKRNVIDIYTDTGLPNATTDPQDLPQRQRNPANIGPPRNIRIGFELSR